MAKLKNISKSDQSFEQKVLSCRNNESAELIQNAAWGHAVFLFENLLQVASEKKESVRLITGHLNNDFYSELSGELDKCIAADVLVELIVLDSEQGLDDNVFYNKIRGYSKGSVITAPNGFSMSAPHMLLIGDDARRFRLEVDHEQTKAVASFNNRGMGETLLSIYNEVKERMNALASADKEAALPA